MHASRECILLTIEGALVADFSEFTSDMQIWQGKLQKFSQISTLGVSYNRFSRTMTFENLHQVCRYGRASCINLQVTFAPTAQQLPTLERTVYKCVAVRCSALQCVAVRCSALQCVAGSCSALQCVAVCCSVSQCVAVRCSALQRVYHRTLCSDLSIDFMTTAHARESSALQCVDHHSLCR